MRVALPVILRPAARCHTGAATESVVLLLAAHRRTGAAMGPVVLRLAARRRTGAVMGPVVLTPERVLTILLMSVELEGVVGERMDLLVFWW